MLKNLILLPDIYKLLIIKLFLSLQYEDNTTNQLQHIS